jgi:hypothetical protein
MKLHMWLQNHSLATNNTHPKDYGYRQEHSISWLAAAAAFWNLTDSISSEGDCDIRSPVVSYSHSSHLPVARNPALSHLESSSANAIIRWERVGLGVMAASLLLMGLAEVMANCLREVQFLLLKWWDLGWSPDHYALLNTPAAHFYSGWKCVENYRIWSFPCL